MKKLRLMIISLLLLLIPVTILGATYKNGDKIDILSASMPEDGTKITFTIPQGKYPSGSTIAIYGEKNVYCPIPGIPNDPKTPDKNPFTLLSEYKFTESDVKDLESADSTFVATMKFDVECGDIYGKIIGSNETAKPSETQASRPSGGNPDSKDAEGNPLKVMASGSVIDTQFALQDTILIYRATQGSYTLADWLVVFKDKVPVAKTLITNELMEKLAEGDYEVRALVEGLTSADGLTVIVSDTDYELGLETVPPVTTKPETPKGGSGMNSLVVGVGVFALVFAAGLGYYFITDKKKAKK